MEKYEKPAIEIIDLLLEQSILSSSIMSIDYDEYEDVDDDWR